MVTIHFDRYQFKYSPDGRLEPDSTKFTRQSIELPENLAGLGVGRLLDAATNPIVPAQLSHAFQENRLKLKQMLENEAVIDLLKRGVPFGRIWALNQSEINALKEWQWTIRACVYDDKSFTNMFELANYRRNAHPPNLYLDLLANIRKLLISYNVHFLFDNMLGLLNYSSVGLVDLFAVEANRILVRLGMDAREVYLLAQIDPSKLAALAGQLSNPTYIALINAHLIDLPTLRVIFDNQPEKLALIPQIFPQNRFVSIQLLAGIEEVHEIEAQVLAIVGQGAQFYPLQLLIKELWDLSDMFEWDIALLNEVAELCNNGQRQAFKLIEGGYCSLANVISMYNDNADMLRAISSDASLEALKSKVFSIAELIELYRALSEIYQQITSREACALLKKDIVKLDQLCNSQAEQLKHFFSGRVFPLLEAGIISWQDANILYKRDASTFENIFSQDNIDLLKLKAVTLCNLFSMCGYRASRGSREILNKLVYANSSSWQLKSDWQLGDTGLQKAVLTLRQASDIYYSNNEGPDDLSWLVSQLARSSLRVLLYKGLISQEQLLQLYLEAPALAEELSQKLSRNKNEALIEVVDRVHNWFTSRDNPPSPIVENPAIGSGCMIPARNSL